ATVSRGPTEKKQEQDRVATREKDLIKAKNTIDFSDVDANKPTLWRVSAAITDDDEVPILLDSLDEKKKLGPATRLSKAFPEEPPEEIVHIILQRPPQ
ncbi:hypothetical protein BGX31_002636, partial [Mortierella sp. GBA43]